jgi:hypothetical protein
MTDLLLSSIEAPPILTLRRLDTVIGRSFRGLARRSVRRIKLLGTAADAKAMLEKTVAALKADKAKTILFARGR